MIQVFNDSDAVAAALTECISTISIENGFRTDIGLKVFQGKTKVEDKQVGKGCISLIEGIDVIKDQPARLPSALIEQRYLFVCYCACDPDHPAVAARDMIADVKHAIFAKDTTLGGRAQKVSYLSRDIGARADGVSIVIAVIEIGVTYVEPLVRSA